MSANEDTTEISSPPMPLMPGVSHERRSLHRCAATLVLSVCTSMSLAAAQGAAAAAAVRRRRRVARQQQLIVQAVIMTALSDEAHAFDNDEEGEASPEEMASPAKKPRRPRSKKQQPAGVQQPGVLLPSSASNSMAWTMESEVRKFAYPANAYPDLPESKARQGLCEVVWANRWPLSLDSSVQVIYVLGSHMYTLV